MKKTKPQTKPTVKREPPIQRVALKEFSAAIKRVLELPNLRLPRIPYVRM